jgi:hypothetical protein
MAPVFWKQARNKICLNPSSFIDRNPACLREADLYPLSCVVRLLLPCPFLPGYSRMPCQHSCGWSPRTLSAAPSPEELDIEHKSNRRGVGCGFLFGGPKAGAPRFAQNNRSPPGQQNAIATGQGNRLGSPFHIQPAVAARKHGEVRQICG